jgi:hypothetical protein
MSEEEPKKGPVLHEPVRQPYHWPRGPVAHEPGEHAARNLAILFCIAAACALIGLLYYMAWGHLP